MSKTAMQKAIEQFKGFNESLRLPVTDIIKILEDKLIDEKEQIETAYLAGWGNSSDYHAENKEEITDEQYYTQTFTQ